MTHESKLALIIGFALLLLVGVVLSDHLTPHGREVAADVARESSMSPTPLPGLSGETESDRGRSGPLAINRIQPRSASAGDPPLIIDQTAGQRSADGIADRPEQNEVRDFRPPLLAATAERWREPDSSRRMTPTPRSDEWSQASDDARWHVVAERDTLYGIAELYYGDGNRWPLIETANASAIRSGVIVPGQRLRIPPDPTQRSARSPSSPRTESRQAAGPRVYEVQEGDTLSEISSRELGSIRHMDAIVDANRGLIDSADEIRVGMKLTLPEV